MFPIPQVRSNKTFVLIWEVHDLLPHFKKKKKWNINVVNNGFLKSCYY